MILIATCQCCTSNKKKNRNAIYVSFWHLYDLDWINNSYITGRFSKQDCMVLFFYLSHCNYAHYCFLKVRFKVEFEATFRKTGPKVFITGDLRGFLSYKVDFRNGKFLEKKNQFFFLERNESFLKTVCWIISDLTFCILENSPPFRVDTYTASKKSSHPY